MALIIGVTKEAGKHEARVAITPDTVKKWCSQFSDMQVLVEKEAGTAAGYSDKAYKEAGATLLSTPDDIYAKADVVVRVSAPAIGVAAQMKRGAALVGNLDPFVSGKLFAALAKRGVHALAMERIPRISRAQAMDTLSSQANIAGYRAVLEAATHLDSFFPLMMTAAGSSKPAKVIVLGAGVAGLQAIATARRLGAAVFAFDVRPEVKEQVESLGAKFIDIDTGESGSGEGGYAKELSAEGKKKQQAALQEVLATADIVVSTALIPGREAPELITEKAVKNMREGAVIVDLAAANGGNCKLTEADKVVVRHGVTLVGYTNFPARVARDASNFFSRNVQNLFTLMLKKEAEKAVFHFDMEDEIVAKATVVYEGEVR